MNEFESYEANQNRLEEILKNDSIATMANPNNTPNNEDNPQITKYTPSPSWKRLLARLIDFGILTILSFVILFSLILTYTLTLNENDGGVIINNCLYERNIEKVKEKYECKEFIDDITFNNNLILILSLCINLVYFIVFPLTKKRGTIGKQVLKIQIVSKENLQTITPLQSVTREVFWIFASIVSIMLIFYQLDFYKTLSDLSFILILLSYIFISFNKFRQGIHDKMAETLVVEKV
jgi:uncharacterized RDD family membrane protein YckC